MFNCDQNQLRQLTRQAWEKNRGVENYIKERLSSELRCAQNSNADDGLPRLEAVSKSVFTLAMTVGTSLEPLLQLACVLKPQRIALILNKKYPNRSGNSQGKYLQRLLVSLSDASDLPKTLRPNLNKEDITLHVLNSDTPTAVFQKLDEALNSPKSAPPAGSDFVNVVDVTGAKKTMIAGAFLYAAHSGLPIVYVDFDSDQYDEQWGRPYGFACKIREISNPYEAFALRDWERVRELVQGYNFSAARELVVEIQEVMQQSLETGGQESLYTESKIAAVGSLIKLLEVYELWDNGDYFQANQKAAEARFPDSLLPEAIFTLGDDWPHADENSDAADAAQALLRAHLQLKEGVASPSESIFNQPERLLSYIYDERDKIKRLVNQKEDYRSAYLRAAGLNEFLLKARMALSWFKGDVKVKPRGDAWREVSSLGEMEHEVFRALVNDASEWKFRKALRIQNGKRQMFEFSRGKLKKWMLMLKPNAPALGNYPFNSGLDMTLMASNSHVPLFVKLRGEAIHTHLTIPKSVAEEALVLIQGAIAEFETNWFQRYFPEIRLDEYKNCTIPNWAEICKALSLDFLPPRLRD